MIEGTVQDANPDILTINNTQVTLGDYYLPNFHLELRVRH